MIDVRPHRVSTGRFRRRNGHSSGLHNFWHRCFPRFGLARTGNFARNFLRDTKEETMTVYEQLCNQYEDVQVSLELELVAERINGNPDALANKPLYEWGFLPPEIDRLYAELGELSMELDDRVNHPYLYRRETGNGG
jgi:hypothetical protein